MPTRGVLSSSNPTFSGVINNRRAAPNVVCWNPLPTLPIRCELHCADAEALQNEALQNEALQNEALQNEALQNEALQQARLLFAPRAEAESDNATSTIWRWEVSHGGDLWRSLACETGEVFSHHDLKRVLANIEYSIVQRLVETVKRGETELYAMHAALLCKDDFAVLVVGPSESGKSTLSCALWRSGWQLLSDDFCFLRDGNRVFPAQRRVSLRDGSRALVGEALWKRIENAPSSFRTPEGWIFQPHEVETAKVETAREFSTATQIENRRVRAILLLERAKESAENLSEQLLKPVNAALAAIRLLPFCTLLPRAENSDCEKNRVLDWHVALPQIAPLVERAPLFSLQRAPLAQMVAAVESASGGMKRQRMKAQL